MRPMMITALALGLLSGSALPATQTVEETRSVAADVRLSIETIAGSIRITAWDREEVHVSGTLGDDVEALEISGNRSSLSIEVEVPDRMGRGRRDIDADLELQVPAGARLSVETVSAPIEVSGISGNLEAESVSGYITVEGSPTRVQLETVSGPITVIGADSAVSAESVSGSIEISGAAGRVEVATVSGTIEIGSGVVENGDFETVAGSITFSGRLASGARLDFEAHSGNVVLTLPAETSARFDVETFSGNIENEFGPQAERTDRYAPGKQLDFTLGGGDARVSIETFSGTVRLRQE